MSTTATNSTASATITASRGNSTSCIDVKATQQHELNDVSRWDFRLRWSVMSRGWIWFPCLLYLWTFGGTFVLDDLYMIDRIERFRAGELDSPALFRFFPDESHARQQRDRSAFVWWAAGGERTAFFRPLPEAAFLLDYAMFGRTPMGYRIVSFAWLILTLMMVRLLVLSTGVPRAVAEITTVFFGIAQTVSMPVGFISNRSDLMAAVGLALASIGYWRYLRARHGTQWSAIALAAAGYAFAMCCKEVAAPLALVWAAHWFVEWRRDRLAIMPVGERHPVTSRVAVVVLGVLMLAGYAVFYWVNEYGVYQSAFTGTVAPTDGVSSGAVAVEATHQMSAMAIRAIEQVGMVLSVYMVGIPASLAVLFQSIRFEVLLCVAGWLLAVMLTPALSRHWRESSVFRFFLIWSVCFAIPPMLATAEPRLLCVASVGWSYCIARMLVDGLSIWRGLPRRLFWEWMLFANAGLAISMGLGSVIITERIERRCQQNIRDYLIEAEKPLHSGGALVVLQPRNRLELWVPGPRLAYVTGLERTRLHLLSIDSDEAVVTTVNRTVVDDDTIEISADFPGIFGATLGPARSTDGRKLALGGTFENQDFVATVTGLERGRITAMRFDFSRNFDSEDLVLVPPLSR